MFPWRLSSSSQLLVVLPFSHNLHAATGVCARRVANHANHGTGERPLHALSVDQYCTLHLRGCGCRRAVVRCRLIFRTVGGHPASQSSDPLSPDGSSLTVAARQAISSWSKACLICPYCNADYVLAR